MEAAHTHTHAAGQREGDRELAFFCKGGVIEACGGGGSGQKGGSDRCFPLPPLNPSLPAPQSHTLPSAQREPRSRSLREEQTDPLVRRSLLDRQGCEEGVAWGRGYGSSMRGKWEAAPSCDPSWRVSGCRHAKQ